MRDFLGVTICSEGVDDNIVPGRVIAAKVSIPGAGSFALYSADLVCGTGWSNPNMDVVDAIVAHKSKHDLPWIIGADWNMDHAEIQKAGILGSMHAVARVPDNADTCISPSCSRTLDFFILDRKLDDGASEALTVMTANTRPHRPVQFRLLAGLKRVQEDDLQEECAHAHGAPDRPNPRATVSISSKSHGPRSP